MSWLFYHTGMSDILKPVTAGLPCIKINFYSPESKTIFEVDFDFLNSRQKVRKVCKEKGFFTKILFFSLQIFIVL